MLSSYYYDNLDARAKAVYGVIQSTLSRAARECMVACADAETAQVAWQAVVMDRPDFINYPGILWGVPQARNNTVRFEFEYSDADESEYSYHLQSALDRLNGKIKSSDDDYAVCKKIYDYLASTVKYSSDVYDKYCELARTNPSLSRIAEFMLNHSNAFSAYGAIVDKRCVCQGVAKAFKVLCERFGIECTCVLGETNDGRKVPHMFNVVELDGIRTFVDVVSGLPADKLPMIRYDYFGATSRMVQKRFTVKGEFGCNDEGASYYTRSGLRFSDAYELKRYLVAFTAHATDGAVRVFYDGKGISDCELRTLFSDIINDHCDSAHEMSAVSVMDGMCNGLITNIER